MATLTNRTTLTIAFTCDLHGEIGPLKEVLRVVRSLEAPVLLVDAGDSFVGTTYFGRAGPAGMARVMRRLGYGAVAVGNHDLEFLPDLANFSRAVGSPLVSRNLCRAYAGVRCSAVVTVAGAGDDVRVGVVGYTDTSSLLGAVATDAGGLGASCDAAGAFGAAILDEAAALRRRADLVVALGHCGYDFDVALFKRAQADPRKPLLDAIVGGHTHLVRTTEGAAYAASDAVVAQAGASGSHIGLLRLDLADAAAPAGSDAETADATRHRRPRAVLAASSEAIPLAAKKMVAKAAATTTTRTPEAASFDAFVDEELRTYGASDEGAPAWRTVEGEAGSFPCRRRECVLGSLVADAMAAQAACAEASSASSVGPPPRGGPIIALLESGSVRGAVEAGALGRDSATHVLPWANTYVLLRFPDAAAVELLLAHGAAHRVPLGSGGAFLQASANARVFLLAGKNDNDGADDGPPPGRNDNTTATKKTKKRRRRRPRTRLLTRPFGDCGPGAATVTTTTTTNPLGKMTLALDDATEGILGARCNGGGWARPEGPVDVVVTSWLADGGDGFGPVLKRAGVTVLARPADVDLDVLRVFLARLPPRAARAREGRIVVVEGEDQGASSPRDGGGNGGGGDSDSDSDSKALDAAVDAVIRAARCDDDEEPSKGGTPEGAKEEAAAAVGDPRRTMSPAVAGVLGAVSTVLGFVATYPLSTLQTRAMLGEPIRCADLVGCGRLYRGAIVAACAVFASGAVFWATHATFTSLISGPGGHARSVSESFASTAAAGVCNVLATNPCWVVVTRLQGGLSAVPTARERRDNPAWLCAGFFPNLGLILVPTLRQSAYELILRTLGATPTTAAAALVTLAASAATLFATVLTHPLQWYRSRLQVASGGFVDPATAMPGHCFDGLTIKVIHTILSATIMYLSKEKLTAFVLDEFEK